MTSYQNTFKKKERLAGKKIIGELFDNGKSMLVYPIKTIFLETGNSTNCPARAAFSVNKKNFKKAVNRNLIKRRMREAYRINKADFYSKLTDKNLAIMFIYVAKDILPFSEVEKSLKIILNKLT